MPCERKHIEAIEEASCIVASCMNGHIGWQLRSRVVNLLHTAIAACDESPWRSMESAPKDGKYLLIRHGDWVPDIAGWRDERPARPGVMAVPPGWFTVAGPRSRILEPTHWMPLPAAPEVRNA